MKSDKKQQEYSKQLIADIRLLLWVVTIGGIMLSWYCIRLGYAGSLPWLTAMVGLPWTVHGTVCAFYLNMAKSDHKVGGITFEIAMAAGFQPQLRNRPTVRRFELILMGRYDIMNSVKW